MTTRLTVTDHDRDAAGLTYVYPVVSRRAGGVSVGVNLNPNNACNWRCIYCQVPDLRRGAAPEIDHDRLEAELRGFLGQIVHGDYLEQHVDEPYRHLVDVAFSGNGEPTTCRTFDEVVDRVLGVLDELGLRGEINLVVISNGSMIHRPEVQRGLARLGDAGGELWFKLDGGTEQARARINSSAMSDAHVLRHLVRAGELLRVRIQTCVFAQHGAPPDEAELQAYLDLLRTALEQGARIHDVMLYGLARPSLQPEAPELARLPEDWMRAFADRVAALGLSVTVHP